MQFNSAFARDIYVQKYSKDGVETWPDTCRRVVDSVCSQLIDTKSKEKIYQMMLERKFIPGGRYLYAAGRPLHQISNCFLFRAEDSREGWADAIHKATMALMTGGGIGFDYSALRPEGARIIRTGGTSTGSLALMNMVNEAGRYIMQGGARRSAIWAGLNWNHGDINKFIDLKNHSAQLRTLKENNLLFPLPMELTNISVIYDTEFFIAIEDEAHPTHEHAKKIWSANCIQAFSTAEPGMSFNFRKDNESLRNAPVSASTRVLTREGYKSVEQIKGKKIEIWTGLRWAITEFKKTRENSELVKVAMSNGRFIICSPEHPFISKDYLSNGKNKEIAFGRINAENLKVGQKILSDLPEYLEKQEPLSLREYGLGFVFGDGSIIEGRGDISFHDENKKESFFSAVKGLDAYFGSLQNRAYFKTSEFKNKKELLKKDILTREFIAGWFDADGCFTRKLLRISNSDKHNLLKLQESLDFYGLKSVVREDGTSSYKAENKMYTLAIFSDQLIKFKELIPTLRVKVTVEDTYRPYRDAEIRVTSVVKLEKREDVYCCDVGFDEHSFMAEGVIVSNCTEVVSEDDSDKCNLGTVWINRVKDKKELAEVVRFATLFLLCGGIYSDVPTEAIKQIGSKNNRIGLGIGGIHEWLMMRDSDYVVTPELHKWLSVYEQESDGAAFVYAKQLSVAVPKGVRAIAPNGSIGILAESTTGIEPLFCKAYKRRYFKEGKWVFQYVVDGAVKRLLEAGIKLDQIKDSADLTFKQRVKFQADVQNYVDMAISSTCNMPEWGSALNNDKTLDEYSKILLKYAKRLRGFTVYPDKCRGGQPLTRVSLQEALADEGKVFEEKENECANGVCGV